MSGLFLGIEIGGTKLQLGVGRADGRSFETGYFERRDIQIPRGAGGILAQIEEAAGTLLSRHQVERIGIGFGGPVDTSAGRVIKSHQVSGWDDFPLAAWCEQRFGVPAVLGNDCDCAALAEASFGAGRGQRIVFYVTVGTGIGGGLVIDGRLHGAGRPAVAEIGHLRPGLEAKSPEATVESLAAGPAIALAARHLCRQSSDEAARRQLRQIAGQDEATWTAKGVFDAAACGNPLAQAAIGRALGVLGWAIAQAITLTAAEVVVVGGGVSLSGEEFFFEPLRKEVARYVFPPLAYAYRVVAASLGEEVVVQGACALAAARPRPLRGQ